MVIRGAVTYFITQKVTVICLVGLTLFMTTKGHRFIRGSRVLFYVPKGHGDTVMTPKCHKLIRDCVTYFMIPNITMNFVVCLTWFMTPKRYRVIRGRRDQLHDPKGHGELCGRSDLVHDPKRSQGH